MCQPCNVVRGRVAEVTDFVAADQIKSMLVHIADISKSNEDGGRGDPTPHDTSRALPTPAQLPAAGVGRRRHLPGRRSPSPPGPPPRLRWRSATSTATASPTSSSRTTAANTVSVLLGNGDGTFAAPGKPSPTGNDPHFGGGRGLQRRRQARPRHRRTTAANTVSVLLGNGDGTFAAARQSFATGAEPDSVAVGGLQRRRQARPRRREPRREHGERAAGQRQRHLRRPASHFATGSSPVLGGGRRTSTATASPDLVTADFMVGNISQ